MLSVILLRNDEPTVVQLTQENLTRELGSVRGAELLLADTWEEGFSRAKNPYVCFVEADCLVSSGYFSSLIGLFLKNDHFRKLAMVSPCVGLDNWGNRIYGYSLQQIQYGKDDAEVVVKQWELRASRDKTSSGLFAIEAGSLPGAVLRYSAAATIIKELHGLTFKNPVELSIKASLFLWSTGRRVHVSPNTTYVSTRKDLDVIPKFSYKLPDVVKNNSDIFKRILS